MDITGIIEWVIIIAIFLIVIIGVLVNRRSGPKDMHPLPKGEPDTRLEITVSVRCTETEIDKYLKKYYEKGWKIATTSPDLNPENPSKKLDTWVIILERTQEDMEAHLQDKDYIDSGDYDADNDYDSDDAAYGDVSSEDTVSGDVASEDVNSDSDSGPNSDSASSKDKK